MEVKKFYDEDIIGIRNKYQESQKNHETFQKLASNDICEYGAFLLDGTIITCRNEEINNKIIIIMPEIFQEEEPDDPGYGYSNPIMYVNEDTGDRIWFDFTERKIDHEAMEVIREPILNEVLGGNPHADMIEKGFFVTEEFSISYFDWTIRKSDSGTYSFMCFFECSTTLVTVTLQGSLDEMGIWSDIFRQMIKNMKKI